MVWQPARGFRYAADAFWLLGFALEGGLPATALDLGTGSGVMALLLAARGVSCTGVDSRSEWGEGWRRSIEEGGHAHLRCVDVRDWQGPMVDLVLCNPPYTAAGSGPSSADPLKAAARTESTATLADFVAVATRHGQRACFVVPCERSGEVRAAGWRQSRVAQVGRKRVLVELVPGDEADAPAEELWEDHPRVVGWYERARGASAG